jgi:hypothetical protein
MRTGLPQVFFGGLTVFVLLLTACASSASTDTDTAETAQTSTTTAVATEPTESESSGYEPLEPGSYGSDAGPGSLIDLLLTSMPETDGFEAVGLQSLPNQIDGYPRLEGCPDIFPIASTERLFGRLGVGGSVFDVVVVVSSMIFEAPEGAQAFSDFVMTPEGAECRERELAAGVEYRVANGTPEITLEDYELVIEPQYDVSGAASSRQTMITGQFGTDIEQEVTSTWVVRGSAVHMFTLGVVPGSPDHSQIAALGGPWLEGSIALEPPSPNMPADEAAERLLVALDTEVERPAWFQPISVPQLASTRIEPNCTSFQNEPIAAAEGVTSVAISQFAGSTLYEDAASFSTEDHALAEVQATIDDGEACILSQLEPLFSSGFALVDTVMEEDIIDGIRYVVGTVNMIQTVQDESFDVRLMAAMAASGTDVVQISFQGLAGDEPDLRELAIARLAVMESLR